MNITTYPHQTYKPNLIYLVYKRLRPAFGLPFGFILMYGAYTNNLTPLLLLVGLGFICIEVMGGWYNDYWDYEEDVKNNRKDKFTTCGLLTREQIGDYSLIIAFMGLVILGFTNFVVFMLGGYYILLFIGYSHPKIRLKGHVGGYILLSSMFLFLPASLNSLYLREFSTFDVLLTLFCFFQFLYVLCQKDSTDLKDKNKNLFLDNSWGRAFSICVLSGTLSSISLLSICFSHNLLFSVWIINACSKSLNLIKIRKKQITRDLRSKLMLIEFLTPYLYVGVILLGL